MLRPLPRCADPAWVRALRVPITQPASQPVCTGQAGRSRLRAPTRQRTIGILDAVSVRRAGWLRFVGAAEESQSQNSTTGLANSNLEIFST